MRLILEALGEGDEVLVPRVKDCCGKVLRGSRKWQHHDGVVVDAVVEHSDEILVASILPVPEALLRDDVEGSDLLAIVRAQDGQLYFPSPVVLVSDPRAVFLRRHAEDGLGVRLGVGEHGLLHHLAQLLGRTPELEDMSEGGEEAVVVCRNHLPHRHPLPCSSSEERSSRSRRWLQDALGLCPQGSCLRTRLLGRIGLLAHDDHHTVPDGIVIREL
mmetsp:Transcript_13148/g.38669  ORF Transcript_13148/g.38669 Transcript_13148/m.38669 type:complete len:216 (+) Transcript_13148:490-1137(+)